MGINFNLQKNDVAVRGNFCTINKNGLVLDRRAGRISTEENIKLCKLLSKINLPDIEVFIKPVKEHRFLLVFRGDKLNPNICDTDPQDIGLKPVSPKSLSKESDDTSLIVQKFIDEAAIILKDQYPANMILLRGFSKKPNLPTLHENFGLNSASIACYPMYKGISRLLGMKILDGGKTIDSEFNELEKNWNEFDFFYIHIKGSDSAGEDGDFERKVKVIEELDKNIPRLMNLKPDVIVITGDHSTPSIMKYHSWHPVPVILWSKYCRKDDVKHFGEKDCIKGGLGPRLPGVDLMPLALANAKKLEKYGA